MGRKAFKLPDIGEGTAEAELVAWHVAVGDEVAEDQPLLDVMTDKATVEVTAPFAGRVVERTGNPGDMLPVGSVVLTFEVGGEAEAEVADTPAKTEPVQPAAPQPVQAQPVAPPPAQAAPPPVAATPAPTPAQQATPVEQSRRVLAAPALRKRAAELGIKLEDIAGSGPNGRIRQWDLDAYIAYANAPKAAPAGVAAAPSVDDSIDEVPVIGLRRRIAERMQDTKRRIPHFSYIEEVDVTQLEQLRAAMNAARSDGRPKLTILPFLIRALTRVLPDFPQINALYDDTAGIVRRHSAVHAGIATQTPQGLVVTVLRNAQAQDVWGVANELTRVSGLARAGRATAADLTGSTITITSLGAMGGLATTPVINSPEVAIVGVNKLIERPIVRDGRIEVAKMMNLSSSFDHRVVDGWDAASFIQRVKALLETPALLFVDL